MLDERKLRLLESKIDAWRMREKDADQRKTYDEVFDQQTLLSLYKLISDGILDTVDYPVATGKEGNVFKATSSEGHAALKIYRVATSTFKNISKYILGDPRFKGLRGSHREVIYTWASKEYKNLQRMHSNGVRVPRPIECHNNLLLMDYIGDETMPAPMLKDVEISSPRKLFKDVLSNMKRINEAGLVHGDLSEFNILIWDGRAVIIDVGQGVTIDHPLAEEWFRRDMRNMTRYFNRVGLKVTEEALEKKVRGG